ncbi:hypothetical protein ACJJTC_016495 [Scirpophaga incertulas]
MAKWGPRTNGRNPPIPAAPCRTMPADRLPVLENWVEEGEGAGLIINGILGLIFGVGTALSSPGIASLAPRRPTPCALRRDRETNRLLSRPAVLWNFLTSGYERPLISASSVVGCVRNQPAYILTAFVKAQSNKGIF